jgi:transitional endoplasmic reticulum ATPase
MEEPFTIIDSLSSHSDQIFNRYNQLTSAKRPDLDVQLQMWFRSVYQKHHITAVPQSNCNFISYANAGHAKAVIDREKTPVISFRGYLGSSRRGEDGSLGEGIRFARYFYTWKDEEFLVYVCQIGMMMINYIIKEAAQGESATGHCKATDALTEAVGRWQEPDDKFVWVFDNNYWQPNPKLYEQVMKASWDNVILNEGMKKELTSIVGKFFDNKKVYEDLGTVLRTRFLWP